MNKKKQVFVKMSGCLPAFEEEREQCCLALGLYYRRHEALRRVAQGNRVVLIGHNARVYSGVVEYMKYEA